MSIIQEALKKAEIKVETPTIRERSVPTPRMIKEVEFTSTPAAKKIPRKHPFNIWPVSVLLIIALLSGVIYYAAPLINNGAKNTPKTDLHTMQEVNGRVLRQAANPEVPPVGQGQIISSDKESAASDYPALALNGIMYREEGARALVNNLVVEEGDIVGGAKVQKISQKNVVFVYNGTEIKISLN